MAEPVAPARSWHRPLLLIATVLGVALTASLGRWQIGRAEQKEALQAAIDSRGSLPPLQLQVLQPEAAADPALLHRSATARGRWLAQHTVFLDNRQMNGRPGFYVLTPLQLEGRRDAVLVQRGWVPRDPLDRLRLPSVPAPSGTVELQGRLAPAPSALYEFSPSGTGPIRQNLEMATFSEEIGVPLWPLSLVQLQPVAGDDDGLLREWPRPATNVHKHQGYAFQWFGLGALIAGLYVWFQVIRPRRAR